MAVLGALNNLVPASDPAAQVCVWVCVCVLNTKTNGTKPCVCVGGGGWRCVWGGGVEGEVC